MSKTPLGDLRFQERRALREGLAVTLSRNASWAADEGDEALEMVMRSVGNALMATAGDISRTDLGLAEDIARRAMMLIMSFHCRYPDYPVGPTLH